MADIFISYARDDDEKFVEQLHLDLRQAGLAVWWDRAAMASRGRTFLQEIRDAIAASSRVVLVLGPRAIESPYVEAEWQFAAELCTPVVPVLRLGDYGLLPPELSRQHCVDVRETRPYDAAFAELLRILKEPIPQLATMLGVNALPRHFVSRDPESTRLSAILLSDTQRPAVIRSARQTTSLQGMAGVGKSVLATAFARACSTRRAFDTIIWLRLGPDADALTTVRHLGEMLHDAALSQASGLASAQATLSAALAGKSLLIVLDDVWDMSQAEIIANALDARCRLLVTTRDGGLARALGAEELPVDALDEDRALLLLAHWSGESISELPPEAALVAAECGYLPLALAMIGAMVRGRADHWPHALARLRAADLQKIRQRFPNYPYPDLFRAIEVSVQALAPHERAAYLDLAVFREETPIPESAIEALLGTRHGMSALDVTDIVDTFVDRSLARRNDRGFLVLHALQVDFIRQAAGDATALHRDLVAGYRLRCPDGWASGPDDGYFFQSLPHHVALAGHSVELTALLSDYAWLDAKMRATNVRSVIVDYDLPPPEQSLLSVKRALQLSAHVLLADPTQLAAQLLGRFGNADDPTIRRLVESALHGARGVWLQPLEVCLRTPADALVATLAGHTDRVNTLAVSADGRRAVSGSSDQTVRVWDLVDFRLLKTLTGHTDCINAVAVTPDGRFAASGAGWPRPFKVEIYGQAVLEGLDLRPSRDTSVRIWDVDEGRELRRLDGHTAAVRAIIFIDGGRGLMSGGDDSALRLWGFGSGDSGIEMGETGGRVVFLAEQRSAGRIFSFTENDFKVWDLVRFGVADARFGIWNNVVGMDVERLRIFLQGTRFEGGSFDLLVWDLTHADPDTEKIDRVDTFESYIRTAASVNDHGSIAVGLSDGSIRLYETMTAPARVLRGHRDEVSALAALPDGTRLLSASYDGTLMLWDLTAAPGAVERERDIYAVAFTPAGGLAVAAFSGAEVEVWDVATRACLYRHELEMPAFVVRTLDEDVALLGLGNGAVSWLDVRSGQLLSEERSHTEAVMALHVDVAGMLAASGCRNGQVKMWDVRKRQELMTLEGHELAVLSVAVLPGGRHAVSVDAGHHCVVWDIPSRRKARELDWGEESGKPARWELVGPEFRATRPSCAVEALDEKHCAVAADGVIAIMDVDTGRRVATLDRPSSDRVHSLRVSQRWGLLASSDWGGSCDVWDLTTRRHRTRFTFDSSSLVCDIGGETPTLVAGTRGLSHDVVFLRLRNLP